MAKEEQAKKLGASACVFHGDAELMASMKRSIDTIPDTISIGHEVAHMIGTLKVGGTHCFLGGVPEPVKISAFQVLLSRYTVTGSLIGGIPDTVEMLDFMF